MLRWWSTLERGRLHNGPATMWHMIVAKWKASKTLEKISSRREPEDIQSFQSHFVYFVKFERTTAFETAHNFQNWATGNCTKDARSLFNSHTHSNEIMNYEFSQGSNGFVCRRSTQSDSHSKWTFPLPITSTSLTYTLVQVNCHYMITTVITVMAKLSRNVILSHASISFFHLCYYPDSSRKNLAWAVQSNSYYCSSHYQIMFKHFRSWV